MEWLHNLFEQYGYLLLFFGLFTESIALPFPGELAMAFAGYMAYLGKTNLLLSMLFPFLGAAMGTAMTYVLGRKLGTPFFEKYGKYVFMPVERLEKLAVWFAKYGTKLLVVSYFIPGLRHFTGYVSGILKIRVRTFLLFNSMGALLWVTTYVTIGRIFGDRFKHLLHLIHAYSWRALACIAVIIVLVILIKTGLQKKKKKALARNGKSEDR
jgi:membrane protein DedA with SNARE-associated domain